MFRNVKIEGVNVCSDHYHAQKQGKERGTPEFVMSPSSLNAFARLPSRWRRGWNPPESKAKAWGALIDCRTLTPQFFDARYAIEPLEYPDKGMKCPSCGSITDSKTCSKCKCERVEVTTMKPWRYGAKFTDGWKSKCESDGKIVVNSEQLSGCDAAIKRLFEPLAGDDVIKRWFDVSERQVLLTGEWHDEETELVIPVSALLDFVPKGDSEFADCAGDFKSSMCAHPSIFEEQCAKLGYAVQGAFDLDMLNAATGQQRSTWCFIIQESFDPWEPNIAFFGQEDGSGFPTFLEIGRKAEFGGYQGLLALYAKCVKHNKWPGYNAVGEQVQGWSVLRPRKIWMSEKGSGIAKFDFETPDAEDAPEPFEAASDDVPT